MRKWHSFCIFNSEGWPVIPEKAVCRFKKRHRDVRFTAAKMPVQPSDSFACGKGGNPLEIFDYMRKYDYEQLLFCHDDASGLKAVIAYTIQRSGRRSGARECGLTQRKKPPLKMHCGLHGG